MTEMDIYSKRGIKIVRGNGALLYDSDGKEYIDCASNVGVNNIGHGNTLVAKAIYDQYILLSNCYSIFDNNVRAQLATKLVQLTKLHQVFFCNSGAEAVEAVIKFARCSTGKTDILCAIRGFHGKTMGALSATWGPEYKKDFMPMLSGITHVPFNNIEKVREAITINTAAVMIELVQGEGGVRIANKLFVKELRKICDEKSILLIIDEVQTGFGRTGTMFCYEQYGIKPDILCLAKAIAGGMPMGAVICREGITGSKHSSTFGGNPLACSAALATIQIIEEDNLPTKAAKLGQYMIEQLNTITSKEIKEIRGVGLMIGIELIEAAGPMVRALQENGVIALLAGKNVIRFLPPLVIKKEQVDEVITILKRTIDDCER